MNIKHILILTILVLAGCKKNEIAKVTTGTKTTTIDKSLIANTWLSVSGPNVPDYYEQYFGPDGFYYSNLNNYYGPTFQYGTYSWGKNDTLIFAGIKIKVSKLTSDSLIYTYISNNYLYKYINEYKPVIPSTGTISTIARYMTTLTQGDGGPVSMANISQPCGLMTDQAGNIYFMDSIFGHLREINAGDSIIHTIAGLAGVTKGCMGQDSLPALSTQLTATENEITIDNNTNNIYLMQTVVGSNARLLYKLSATDQKMYIICGNIIGYSGDGGPATKAAVSNPGALRCDAAGNIYFSDQSGTVIRKISATDGTISTIAGTAIYGDSGDGAPAINATINVITMAIDNNDNVLFGTQSGQALCIRKIDTKTGLISTIAGNGKSLFSGDGLNASQAGFDGMSSITVNKNGDIFIADNSFAFAVANDSHRIRKIAKATNIITTVAGCEYPYFSIDGNYLTAKPLDPHCIAIDNYGNIIAADFTNSRIRKIVLP